MEYRVKIQVRGQWANDWRKRPYTNLEDAGKRFKRLVRDGRQAAIVDSNNVVIIDTMAEKGLYQEVWAQGTPQPTF